MKKKNIAVKIKAINIQIKVKNIIIGIGIGRSLLVPKSTITGVWIGNIEKNDNVRPII